MEALVRKVLPPPSLDPAVIEDERDIRKCRGQIMGPERMKGLRHPEHIAHGVTGMVIDGHLVFRSHLHGLQHLLDSLLLGDLLLGPGQDQGIDGHPLPDPHELPG